MSYGIAAAAANLPVERGRSVVVLDRQFPSNVYAWQALARRREARLRTVLLAPGRPWTPAVLDAIDRDTAVVAVPNCHWTDGGLLDLVQVGAAARSVGAGLVVDASQSLGAFPLDVTQIQPDFLVTVGYKWLLGPYGLAYLFVAPRWRERGLPLEESWLTRAGAEDFTSLVDYSDRYREGARRFDMGGFPQFVLMPMAIAALEQILAWGVERIQATLSELFAVIEDRAPGFGGVLAPREHRVGHMAGIRLPRGLPPNLAESLAAAGVYLSIRGDCIRVAPHLHCDRSDIERLVALLERHLG